MIANVFIHRCDTLQQAHNTFSDFMKDKARVRSLGKDGASQMQGSLRTAATILIMHSTLHEVTWMSFGINGLTSLR